MADFILDTVTGSGNLSTHTGETGATWTLHPDSNSGALTNFVLNGSGLVQHQPGGSSLDTFVTPSGTPVSAEYAVEVIFRIPSATHHSPDLSVFARYQSSPSRYYWAYVDPDPFPATTATIYFIERDAGGSNTLYIGTISLADDTDHTLLMEISDAAKKLTINGTLLANSAVNGATAAGEIVLNQYTQIGYAGFQLTSFRAYDIAPPPPPAPTPDFWTSFVGSHEVP